VKEAFMDVAYSPLEVRIWGDFACFTRPEMKVERVSYPVLTPSAARGVLEAILWKPQFAWRIGEIWVLKPIRYFSILRNEVNTRASERAAAGWSKYGGGYDASADRAQRHTLALREVA
jgi:CRISPR-associated protein Cas5d